MTGIIILAGGENTRIGENKALLDLGGKPLIEHMVNKLKNISEKIYIVSDKAEEYSFIENVEVVPDIYPDKKSILEAVYSGLKASTEEYNFVCACDMPYLNINLIKYLFKVANNNFDAVIPVVKYKTITLHAIYSKSVLPLMEKSIEKNHKIVKRVLRDLNVKYVPEEALITEDEKLRSFFHIKTFLDYILAQTDF